MYLHVVSALPTGARHAILRSWQNIQAIACLHRALLIADGNLNTLCPALRFGTRVGVGSDVNDVAAMLSIGVKLNAGVPSPVWEDENDDECGVGNGSTVYGRHRKLCL